MTRSGMTATNRDPLVDNVRFILVTFVVVGHFLTTFRAAPQMNYLYVWIYTFHMPAFVYLSGLMVTSYTVTAEQGRKTFTTLIVPLVTFTGLFQLFGTLTGKSTPSDGGWGDPFWLLWFITALTIWRMMLPVIGATRVPLLVTFVTVPVVLVVTELTGLFSLDRVVTLLPFFVAGCVTNHVLLQKTRSRVAKVTAGVAFAISVPVTFWVSELPTRFTMYTDPVNAWGDIPTMFGLYAAAALLTFVVITVTPAGRSKMTVWGGRTMYVYLLHGFIVQLFRGTTLSEQMNNPAGWVGIVITGILVTIILSSTVVNKIFKPLVEPNVTKLLPQLNAKGNIERVTPHKEAKKREGFVNWFQRTKNHPQHQREEGEV
jgi:fucose 4-O-acetylase-like acetyltransferase